MAEGRRLRLLEVGLVRHPGLGMAVCYSRDSGSEPGGIRGEFGHLGAQSESQRDPCGLAAGAARMQPAGVVAQQPDEPAFAAVVDLAERGIVRELRRRDPQRLEGSPQQGAQRFVGYDLAGAQVEQVRQIGEPQPAVQ